MTDQRHYPDPDSEDKSDERSVGLVEPETRTADDDDLFTGNSARAQNIRQNMEVSGAGGSFSSVGGAGENRNDPDEKDKEDSLQDYLQMQIAALTQDIKNLEDMLQKYQEQMEQEGKTIEKAAAAVTTLDKVIDDIDTQDAAKTYAQFVIEAYDNRVLTNEPGNLLEALQNPLTDESGNMVYLDEQGLYHLDAETGGRLRYDALEAAPLIEKMMDKNAPVLPANYTFKGQDPTNVQAFQIVSISADISPEMAQAVPGYLSEQQIKDGPSTDRALTIKKGDMTLGDIRQVCDQYRCEAVEMRTEAELKFSQISILAEKTESRLGEAEERYAALTGKPVHGSVTDSADSKDGHDAPALKFDEQQAKLDQMLLRKIEHGAVALDALRDMTDKLPPQAKEYVLSKIEERGIDVVDPIRKISVNIRAPEVLGGLGPRPQKIADISPNIKCVSGLNTMPTGHTAADSVLSKGFTNIATTEPPAPAAKAPEPVNAPEPLTPVLPAP